MVVSCLESIGYVLPKNPHLYPCLVSAYAWALMVVRCWKTCQPSGSMWFLPVLTCYKWGCRCHWQKEDIIICDRPLQLALHEVGSVPSSRRTHRQQGQCSYQESHSTSSMWVEIRSFFLLACLAFCPTHLSKLRWECVLRNIFKWTTHTQVLVNKW